MLALVIYDQILIVAKAAESILFVAALAGRASTAAYISVRHCRGISNVRTIAIQHSPAEQWDHIRHAASIVRVSISITLISSVVSYIPTYPRTLLPKKMTRNS